MRHAMTQIFWWSVRSLICGVLLTACTSPYSTHPSPDPQDVLTILRHYPGGTKTEDRILYSNGGDTTYRISFTVQTTSDAAISYYRPLLSAVGIDPNPSRSPTRDDHPVNYRWLSTSCPYHAVAIGVTTERLEVTYTYGPCI